MIRMTVNLTPESREVIARHQGRAARLIVGLSEKLKQWVQETAGWIAANYLRGGNVKSERDGKAPLAVRSGRLLGSVEGGTEGELSAFVQSRGTRYGKVLLGSETWIIKPKTAKHLWIPIADNLTASGQTRYTPRAAMDVRTSTGRRALRIFKSKAGNMVAFLPGNVVEDKAGQRLGLVKGGALTAFSAGKYKSGKNKGKTKGQLLFVLKDQVEVKGTDALASGVTDRLPRLGELLQGAVDTAMSHSGEGVGGAG